MFKKECKTCTLKLYTDILKDLNEQEGISYS